jgi:hypothetical protein
MKDVSIPTTGNPEIAADNMVLESIPGAM